MEDSKMKIDIPQDLKSWYAISCPTGGLRFDARTLELLDSNRDGHIRSEEVQAALARERVFTTGSRKHMPDWMRISFGTPAEMAAFKTAFAKVMGLKA